MVNQQANNMRTGQVTFYRWAVYQVQIRSNDTFTAQEFSNNANLKFAVIIDNDTGEEYDCTYLNNVVTFSQQGILALQDCTIFLYGRRAQP